MAKRLPHQQLDLREHEPDVGLAIIVAIDETIPGTALDEVLWREQTAAILELIAAHLSRVHSVPRNSVKEEPRD